MTTKLVEPLKREIDVDGVPYTLTITPRGLGLVVKGRRKGYALEWSALVSGDAALAAALNASLAVRAPNAATSTDEREQPKRRKP
jgi:hypothetical protein